MKVEDLKFPMIVHWVKEGHTYAVEEDNGQLHYSSVGKEVGYYPNSTGKRCLADQIGLGRIVILAQPPKADTVDLTINVEATQATAKLQEATKAAEQLVAALGNVKELLK